MALITDIKKNSAAQRAGVVVGEELLSINGHIICDIFDYLYYSLTTVAVLQLGSRQVKIYKQQNSSLGLVFEGDLWDGKRGCKNRCIFCFIDQLPPGLRRQLYLKDDDERLSFLFGNYITLTNLSRALVARIIRMRISPINISVHTTNGRLRQTMMNNPDAARTLALLRKFAQSGISMNIQLVLCPGINDGDELVRSISDLRQLCPSVQSVAVVPVGLTRYRQNLTPIEPFSAANSKEVINIIKTAAAQCEKKFGCSVFYAADEFYLKAGQRMPSTEKYDAFLQLENGVGMWRKFYDKESRRAVHRSGGYDVATGVLAAPMINKISSKITKEKVFVHTVINEFFGENITVSGLLTGKDIIEQLNGKLYTNRLLLPANMFSDNDNLTLDDMPIKDISSALNVDVTATDCFI